MEMEIEKEMNGRYLLEFDGDFNCTSLTQQHVEQVHEKLIRIYRRVAKKKLIQ